MTRIPAILGRLRTAVALLDALAALSCPLGPACPPSWRDTPREDAEQRPRRRSRDRAAGGCRAAAPPGGFLRAVFRAAWVLPGGLAPRARNGSRSRPAGSRVEAGAKARDRACGRADSHGSSRVSPAGHGNVVFRPSGEEPIVPDRPDLPRAGEAEVQVLF